MVDLYRHSAQSWREEEILTAGQLRDQKKRVRSCVKMSLQGYLPRLWTAPGACKSSVGRAEALRDIVMMIILEGEGNVPVADGCREEGATRGLVVGGRGE
jgi:hypothetical protein